ncbi:MAG: nucleotide exchange factor GrpE [Fusicatenibacter sp.]|nr:nucleotide exchange factor GrpE [Fusicatenibacter sp.]
MEEEKKKEAEENMEEPTRDIEKEMEQEADKADVDAILSEEQTGEENESKGETETPNAAEEEMTSSKTDGDSQKEASDEGKERKFFKKKKDKKDEKIEELTDRLTRQMAEFDNFRKRTEKEKANMYAIGARDIVEKILPVVDNFERGLATVEHPEEDPFADGMNKVYKQLTKTLEDLGVTVIEAVGKEFDPNLHNAVMHVEDETVDENIIVEEFQKGYKYKETVVRHSMVKVAN